ncbi:MAG: hypothetical protein K2J65_08165 [Duncaniella sp.]|nr:hypothetical protein [Duncaniella sp.]
MKKQYTSYIRNISPRPRSKRLRELGGGVVSVASGGAAASGDGHSHANKELLDSLALDDDGNLSTKDVDSEGDTIYTPYLKKAIFDDLFEKVVITEGRYAIRTKYDLYSDGDITALGRLALSAPGGSGTGVAGMYYGDWTDYSEDYDSYAVSGKSGKVLYDLIKNAGGGGVDASQLGSLTISRNGVTAGVYSPSKASVIDITVPTRLSELIDDKGYLGRADADSRYLRLSGGSMDNTNLVANLNADLLDGLHAMGKDSSSGLTRSWARGTYTNLDEYYGNGNVVVFDPAPTSATSAGQNISHSANTILLSLGESSLRYTQLVFYYDTDTIRYRRKANSDWQNWVTLLHTGNYSSVLDGRYVKKSGDTMSGTLRVPEITGLEEYSGMLSFHPSAWSGVTNQQWGLGAATAQGVIRSTDASLLHYRHGSGTLSTIWDSGNDGHGSGLDADMLDGLHGGDFARSYNNMWTNGETVAEWAKRVVTSPGINSMVGWAWASSANLTLGSYTIDREQYSAIDFRNGNLNNTWNQKAILFLPTYRDSSMIYIAQMTTNENAGVVTTTVKRYADYDKVLASNVASATKWQTARRFWGQLADGTADVNGAMTVNYAGVETGISIYRQEGAGAFIRYYNNNQTSNYFRAGMYGAGYFGISYNSGTDAFAVTASGSVGIGTTTPAYKLDVNGSALVTSLLISSGLVEWDASRNAFKFNGNLYATGDITALGSSTVGGSGSGGGVDTLAQLADVTLSGLSAGHALVYDGTKWTNRSIAAAGLDLSGLAQYLSTNQYLTQPAADGRYVTLATEQTITGKKTFTSECTTVTRQMRVDGASSSFAALPHLMLHIPNVNWAKFVLKNDGTVHLLNGGATDFNSYGRLTASAFVKYGGTSSQYLMADGSVREQVYFRQNCGNIPVEYVDITNYGANAAGYANYQSGTYMVSRDGYSNILVNLALNAGSTSALQFLTSYSDSAPLYFRKTIDSNRVSGPWREILTSVNYTSFVNPANFVTALGTSGNYLTWTKNGVTNNITVPYATNANGLTNNSDMTYGVGRFQWFNIYATAGCTAKANDAPTSEWWHILRLNHANNAGYYTDIAVPFNHDSLYWKCVRNGRLAHTSWIRILDTLNYASILDSRYVKKSGDTMSGILYAPRIDVGNMYWEAGSGIMPTIAGNNTLTCGKADGRWANVYATTINVTSTSLVANLNADLLDGYHSSHLYRIYEQNAKHDQTSCSTLNAIAGNADSWLQHFSLSLINNNNALNFYVGGLTNERTAMIQSGHNNNSYANALGVLHLNPLGGAVYINKVLAATINSNVASATKLQTARSLWGQSFDGTADVNGAMTVNYAGVETGISIYRREDAGAFIRYYNNNQTTNYFRAGMYGAGYFGISYNSGADAFAVTASGNVGIGTTTPAYKLDVAGDMIASGWLRTRGGQGWYSETYGGGWYMSDTTWLRVHGNKNIYQGTGIIRTDGEFQIGDSGNKFRVDAQGNAYVQSIYVGGILLSHDTVNGGLKITGNAYTTGDLTALGVMGGAQSITMLGVNTTNPAYNLDVNGTGRFTGLLNLSSGATHMGARVGNTYINSIDGNLIFQNVDQIRFGGDAWNYAQWAGLKYNHSAKTIYLGIADGNTFATAGTAQTGGKLSLVNCDLVVPQGYKIQLGPITIIYNAATNSIDIQGNVRYTGTLSKA